MAASTGSSRFAPLDRRRAFEAIVDQVRDAIFAGRYRIGQRLPAERELAEQFGVARHAVREAIRVLEHAGLVVVRRGAQGGIYVAAPYPEAKGPFVTALLESRGFSVEHLFRAKLLLEPTIVELVALEGTDDDLAQVGAALAREQGAIGAMVKFARAKARPVGSEFGHGAGPGEAYPEVADFHRTLAGLVRNPLVEKMTASVEEAARLLHAAARPDASVYRLAHREHREIYEALRRRRPEAARAAMAEHLKAMETRYLKALKFQGGMPARRATAAPRRRLTRTAEL